MTSFFFNYNYLNLRGKLQTVSPSLGEDLSIQYLAQQASC